MNFTRDEIDTLIQCTWERDNRMFRDFVAYKKSGNKEAMMDCLAEMRKARDLRIRLHEEQLKNQIEDEQEELTRIVREKGEQDGNIYRFWLHDLNGVCDLEGHTDILCGHLGEDGLLTFQVNSPDDDSTIFVYLTELPFSAACKVINQIKEM